MLVKIRDDLSLECLGFRVLCFTRWTVHANTLKSILDNWTAINSVWTISLEEKLNPEIRGRIIGVQTQMVKFEGFFGINILQILLDIMIIYLKRHKQEGSRSFPILP